MLLVYATDGVAEPPTMGGTTTGAVRVVPSLMHPLASEEPLHLGGAVSMRTALSPYWSVESELAWSMAPGAARQTSVQIAAGARRTIDLAEWVPWIRALAGAVGFHERRSGWVGRPYIGIGFGVDYWPTDAFGITAVVNLQGVWTRGLELTLWPSVDFGVTVPLP